MGRIKPPPVSSPSFGGRIKSPPISSPSFGGGGLRRGRG